MSIAYFDFDNTLISGDAGPMFGRHLFRTTRRPVTIIRFLPYIAWMLVQAALYRVGAVRRSTIVRNAYRALKGVPVPVFRHEMDAFVDDVIPHRIHPGMRAEIEKHVADGRRLVVITTGIEGLVRRAVRHLPGRWHVIGCHLDAKDDRLTGHVTGPLYGVDKANILKAYARALDVDVADCYAYSDHYSDKHMLEAVGHPVAVDPRGRLRRMAVRRGWRIVENA